MDPQVGQSLDSLSFILCSTLCPCISFRQEQLWVKILEMGGWPHPSIKGCVYPLDMVSTGFPSPLWGISANAIPSQMGPGRLLLSWHLGLSGCCPLFSIPHCYTPLFNFLILCTSPQSPPTPDPALFPPPTLPSLPGPSLLFYLP